MILGYTILAMNFVYAVILACMFFIKKRVINIETKIFSSLVISNLLGLVLEFLCGFYIKQLPDFQLVTLIINKLHIANISFWLTSFTFYVVVICFGLNTVLNKFKKLKLLMWSYLLLLMVIIFMLPIEFFNDGNYIYSYGIAVDMTIILSTIYLFVDIYSIIKNHKKLSMVKLSPLIILIIGFIAVFVVRQINPGLVLMTTVFSLVILIMQFTIENPDMKMANELQLAKDAAEKANRAKSDFLSSMSHEIRTPLNAIVGFSQMIESEDSIDACKEDAKDIVMASNNLLEIVNGILDISKIEANKMEIVNKEYYLLPEMENLSKLMIPRIGEKSIELVTEFAPDIPDIMYGDIGKIKQIVTNLLTNSVKYTESGRIEFKINCINDKDKCSLVISVEDTGRGIKPEKINTLFTKFNRLEEDKNSTIEGTGLGLAITKSLVDMMGGRIVVQSKYGEGSKFTVYLAQKIVKMDAGIDLATKTEELNHDFSGYKVLVVDDNKLNLKVAEKILKGFNIEITLVESGFECIDLIKANEKYDLILMDDMMPKMKGTETLIKLKEIPSFNIPVIALTANALSGIREKYIQEGFNDYLGKPIEKEELVDLLSKYLVKKQTTEPMLPKEEIISEKTSEIQKTNNLGEVVNSNGKKILIVDDNKLNIKVAAHVMKPYNFVIEEAYSGQECIEKVKNNKYDLIFMDYMMPVMDGIQTLDNLKKLENFDTPVIALTADSVDGARQRFLDAGFNEYISKPLNKEIFSGVMNKFIDNNNQSSESISVENENKNNLSNNTNLFDFSNANADESNDVSNDEIASINYLEQNGIDVSEGINLLGTEKMYNEIMKDFILTVQERVIKLNKYFNASDITNYTIEVQTLKSDSTYLGFKKLAELAFAHEMRGRAKDIEYIKTHYEELMKEFARVYEIIKKI